MFKVGDFLAWAKNLRACSGRDASIGLLPTTVVGASLRDDSGHSDTDANGRPFPT